MGGCFSNQLGEMGCNLRSPLMPIDLNQISRGIQGIDVAVVSEVAELIA